MAQINENGDERIDHSEFVSFFLRLLEGTTAQKMLIAFRVYDFEDDQAITPEAVKFVLKSLPSSWAARYGISFPDDHNLGNMALLTRSHLNHTENLDNQEINLLVDAIFKSHSGEMFFDEFSYLTEHITSELYFSILQPLFYFVPCC